MHSTNRIDVLHKAVEWPVNWAVFGAVDDPDHPALDDLLRSVEA